MDVKIIFSEKVGVAGGLFAYLVIKSVYLVCDVDVDLVWCYEIMKKEGDWVVND